MATSEPGGTSDSIVLHEALHPNVVIEELDRTSSSNSAVESSDPAQPQPQPRAAPERDTASDAVSQEESESEADDEAGDMIASLMGGLNLAPGQAEAETRPPVLSSFDLEGIASYIKAGKAKNIICMCGAGLSVSAGIPDFRTPGTGLYSNLQKFDLPYPEAVFEINYFKRNPAPFFMLAKELFPGTFVPTPAHFVIKLLHDKGLLLRCFTQNIDSLENQAGLPKSAIVAAHGNFDSAHCVRCQLEHSLEHVRKAVQRGDTKCLCESCEGLVKPDIVFFGESLPGRFFQHLKADFPKADLLIVLGTSLTVQPFASLIDKVRGEVPRILINRERVGEGKPELQKLGIGFGFNFGEGNSRDVLYLGDCDNGAKQLCEQLGWTEELDSLIAEANTKEHEAHNPMNPAAL